MRDRLQAPSFLPASDNRRGFRRSPAEERALGALTPPTPMPPERTVRETVGLGERVRHYYLCRLCGDLPLETWQELQAHLREVHPALARSLMAEGLW